MSKIKFVFLLILGFIIYKGYVAIKNFEIGVDKEVAQIEKMGFEKKDKVIGIDIDKKKIRTLNSNKSYLERIDNIKIRTTKLFDALVAQLVEQLICNQ